MSKFLSSTNLLKLIENIICDSDDRIHKIELESVHGSLIKNPKIHVYVGEILSMFAEVCEAPEISQPWCERIENMSSFDVLY